MSSVDTKSMVWNFRLELGKMVPYNGNFYIVNEIKNDSVTLVNENSKIKVSKYDIESVIRRHNSPKKRSRSRSQSPYNRKRSRGGKKSRKKRTLKRRK